MECRKRNWACLGGNPGGSPLVRPKECAKQPQIVADDCHAALQQFSTCSKGHQSQDLLRPSSICIEQAAYALQTFMKHYCMIELLLSDH